MARKSDRFVARFQRLLAVAAQKLKAKRSHKPDPYAGRYVQPSNRRNRKPDGITARQWAKLSHAGKMGNAAEATALFRRYVDSPCATPGHPFRETGVPAWRRNRRAPSKNRCARVWKDGAA